MPAAAPALQEKALAFVPPLPLAHWSPSHGAPGISAAAPSPPRSRNRGRGSNSTATSLEASGWSWQLALGPPRFTRALTRQYQEHALARVSHPQPRGTRAPGRSSHLTPGGGLSFQTFGSQRFPGQRPLPGGEALTTRSLPLVSGGPWPPGTAPSGDSPLGLRRSGARSEPGPPQENPDGIQVRSCGRPRWVGGGRRTEEVQGALCRLLHPGLAHTHTLVRSHAYRLPTRGGVQAREPWLGSGRRPQWGREAALVGTRQAEEAGWHAPAVLQSRGRRARVLTAQSPGCWEPAPALRA